MATVRIIHGSVDLPPGERPDAIHVPTEPGERVIGFARYGGHTKNDRSLVQHRWWATVTKED